jgi:alanyl-tRNA synthetase
MTETELQQVEDFVNARIRTVPLIEEEVFLFSKQLRRTWRCLEKYGDESCDKIWRKHGTLWWIHVKNTAEIWHFKIVSEGAVAAGIRRMRGITVMR